ncbi:MAG: hypothetical protein ACP6IY_07890 [Promethearchaeia archaeon]
MSSLWIEVLGLIGSGFVGISLAMRNILKLRILNTIGALLFIFYGLILLAYSVFIVNFIILLVNIYYLITLMEKTDKFSILEIKDINSPFLVKFINYYFDDIKKFFPEFSLEDLKNTNNLIILRNMIPVGIFISKPLPTGEMEVILDYVIPDYRDFKNAHFLYLKETKRQKMNGFHTFITRTENKKHSKYLLKIGYIQDSEDKTLYKKEI